jgi:hypothetical protein
VAGCCECGEERSGSLSVRFQVLTASRMEMTVFLAVAPCSLVEIDRCFRGAYCFHHLRDDGGSKQL